MSENNSTGYTRMRQSASGNWHFTVRLFSMAILAHCFMFFSSAHALITGTLVSNIQGGTDTSGGLTAINAVAGQLTWTVDQLQNGAWKYTYQVIPYSANRNSGIGSLKIQFGQQPTDISSSLGWVYTYVGSSTTMGTATSTGTLQTIDRTIANTSEGYTYDSWLLDADPTGSRVNVTTTFQGLAWIINQNAPNGSISVTLELTTSLAPMWGNIYMDGYNLTTRNGYGMMRNTNYDTPSPLTFSLTGTPFNGKIPVPGSHVLTLGFAGTGGGSVSDGISCASGSACDPLIIMSGAPLSLIPTNDSNSYFAGWGGACTNVSGDCLITMDADRTVTAIFNAYDTIRIGSTPYTTLSNALSHAADGLIVARAMTFPDTLDVTVVSTEFRGGFDTSFSSNSGQFTTLQGTMTVSTGSLIVEGLAII